MRAAGGGVVPMLVRILRMGILARSYTGHAAGESSGCPCSLGHVVWQWHYRGLAMNS